MEESLVASSKDYKDFVLEQLSLVPNVSCRPMMGEFLLYSDGVLFGGIYDDRLLVKTVPENEKYKMPEAIPYPGAKLDEEDISIHLCKICQNEQDNFD